MPQPKANLNVPYVIFGGDGGALKNDHNRPLSYYDRSLICLDLTLHQVSFPSFSSLLK